MHDRDRAQAVDNEVAILVRVVLSGETIEEDPLGELDGLATTAGALVVGEMVQRRDKPDTTTYIGKGKVEELKTLVDFHAADIVIFDNDLGPAQTRNLEQTLKVKVLDRTELILDIFATRAQTYESRLAVELAQLEYSLPRLKRMWTHLSRLKMGVGMREPGEKQLEVDRRLVEKRIHDLRTELKKIEDRKERQVSSRRDHMTVSLVGYTNAGKSTLMNALTTAEVLAADKLFATLDTRTRRWHLPNWGPILLSDTVGFIRNLPHRLVTSFKATLEETHQADLLLHVADASQPAVFQQIMAVNQVLEELGIDEKNTLLVLNKVDAVENVSVVEGLRNRFPKSVVVSARSRHGFDNLAQAVSAALSRSFLSIEVESDVSNGKLVAFLSKHGDVEKTDYFEDRLVVRCRLPQKYLGRLDDWANVEVRHRNAENREEFESRQPPISVDLVAKQIVAEKDASERNEKEAKQLANLTVEDKLADSPNANGPNANGPNANGPNFNGQDDSTNPKESVAPHEPRSSG